MRKAGGADSVPVRPLLVRADSVAPIRDTRELNSIAAPNAYRAEMRKAADPAGQQGRKSAAIRAVD